MIPIHSLTSRAYCLAVILPNHGAATLKDGRVEQTNFDT